MVSSLELVLLDTLDLLEADLLVLVSWRTEDDLVCDSCRAEEDLVLVESCNREEDLVWLTSAGKEAGAASILNWERSAAALFLLSPASDPGLGRSASFEVSEVGLAPEITASPIRCTRESRGSGF